MHRVSSAARGSSSCRCAPAGWTHRTQRARDRDLPRLVYGNGHLPRGWCVLAAVAGFHRTRSRCEQCPRSGATSCVHTDSALRRSYGTFRPMVLLTRFDQPRIGILCCCGHWSRFFMVGAGVAGLRPWRAAQRARSAGFARHAHDCSGAQIGGVLFHCRRQLRRVADRGARRCNERGPIHTHTEFNGRQLCGSGRLVRAGVALHRAVQHGVELSSNMYGSRSSQHLKSGSLIQRCISALQTITTR